LSDRFYSPAYIAGVTNPIFEQTGNWDLLCDVGVVGGISSSGQQGGRMVISKDIHARYPANSAPIGGPPVLTRTGTLRNDAIPGEEEVARKDKDYTAKADNPDNLFVEEVSS
jgi:hypothetical protein